MFSRAEHLIMYNYCTQELITTINTDQQTTAILRLTVNLAILNSQGKQKQVLKIADSK